MNRKLYQSLTGLMWLSLPLTALRFWMVWDQLPLRMATHFNASGLPNGWMSREVALQTAMGITAVMLAIFTSILLVMQKQKGTEIVSWAFLAFSYLVVGFVFVINNKVVTYNLGEHSMDLRGWIVLPPVAVVIFTTVYLFASRRAALPPAVPIVEEVHGSALFGVLLMAPALGLLFGTAMIPGGGFRLAMVLIELILLVCGLAAWNGFHYLFTQHGLEIRTLGFRLRSIPAEQIERYSIGSWNLLRGYGIRGVGNLRAYVWGNRGVNVTTLQGDLFLGHDEPERIIRDLDMVTRNRRAHEVSPR